jgi:CheY-like chemotaxis protein
VARNAGDAMGYLLSAGTQSGSATASRSCVVFLDLSLPNVDGLGLLQCIRADYAIRSVPVVIFSASMRREDILRAYAEGANSYVHKPDSADKLFETVKLLATYWLNLNEPAPHI